jgi:Family of unknown function (DUF6494)
MGDARGGAGLWRMLDALAVRGPRPGVERSLHSKGGTVDEEIFNMSVRKFLKKLGVTAQREIELAVREQLEAGDLRGDETLDATATVTIAGLSRDVVVTGQISLA